MKLNTITNDQSTNVVNKTASFKNTHFQFISPPASRKQGKHLIVTKTVNGLVSEIELNGNELAVLKRLVG